LSQLDLRGETSVEPAAGGQNGGGGPIGFFRRADSLADFFGSDGARVVADHHDATGPYSIVVTGRCTPSWTRASCSRPCPPNS